MPEVSKPAVNWAEVERQYRAGIKTLRLIASEHGVTHTAINKRANKEGWTRDLNAKIRARAEEKVSKSVVSTEVSKQRLATERETVEANAELQAQVIIAQRKDIQGLRKLVNELSAELSLSGNNIEALENLAVLMAKGEELSDKRLDAVMKAISLPSRVMSVEKLVNAFSKLVALERQAFGIDREEEKPKDPLEGMSEEQLAAEMQAIFSRMRIVEGESVRV